MGDTVDVTRNSEGEYFYASSLFGINTSDFPTTTVAVKEVRAGVTVWEGEITVWSEREDNVSWTPIRESCTDCRISGRRTNGSDRGQFQPGDKFINVSQVVPSFVGLAAVAT